MIPFDTIRATFATQPDPPRNPCRPSCSHNDGNVLSMGTPPDALNIASWKYYWMNSFLFWLRWKRYQYKKDLTECLPLLLQLFNNSEKKKKKVCPPVSTFVLRSIFRAFFFLLLFIMASLLYLTFFVSSSLTCLLTK